MVMKIITVRATVLMLCLASAVVQPCFSQMSKVSAQSALAKGQQAADAAKSGERPRVFLLDQQALEKVKNAGRDSETLAAVKRAADRALGEGPFSVMQKEQVPPSGDKHDYMSQAPYFWPNPKTANGLPYIRKDGERNPEIRKISDHDELGKLCHTVRTLALGFYVTGGDAYAKRATLLLRTWFLDPATRMNPNLNFGQGIPGINTGRSIGIIETAGLPEVVDAVGLLDGSSAWTPDDQKGMQDWIAAYASWLENSDHGKRESAAKNNHGTYYDLQLADLYLFIGNTEGARQIIRNAEQKRIALQVMPDGSQPLELARTRTFSYSAMNLRGLIGLAMLGDHVGVDLWHFSTPDGRSIRGALDYLLPYATGEKKWERKQITSFNPRELLPMTLLAAEHFDQRYLKQADAIAGSDNLSDLHLLGVK